MEESALIQLVTRCTSAEEFIERFARFATATDIVVPAMPHVSVGTERPFVIRLKDGSVMMKGRCEVAEVRPMAAALGAAAAPAAPALMRLHLREMDAHSCGIHLRLMERHAAPAATPPDVSEATVVGEAPLPPDAETTDIAPLPRRETRAPGAAFTLPANPLSDLDAADLASFVELRLHESGTKTEDEPTLVAPPAPAAPSAPSGARLAGAGRIARRFAPHAACVIVGLALGIALRSGFRAAPVAAAPSLAPPPATAPPSAEPEPELGPAPEDDPPPENRTITTERDQGEVVAQRVKRSSSKEKRRGHRSGRR